MPAPSDDEIVAKRAADAERQRRRRRLARRGLKVRRVTVDDDAVADALVQAGWLLEAELVDDDLVNEALARIIDDSIRAGLVKKSVTRDSTGRRAELYARR